MKKIIIVLFVALSAVFFVQRPNSITEVENAEKTTLALKYLRISLEKYYQQYGLYPENLSKDTNFLKLYNKKEIEKTKAFDDYEESNQIHIVGNFKGITEDGGWNYNPNTGEIRANLKFDSYHQRIDWSMM